MWSKIKEGAGDLVRHLTYGSTYMIKVLLVAGYFSLFKLFATNLGLEAVANFCGEVNTIGMDLFLPVTCAFIAQSIGDKGALGPGFILGMLAYKYGTGFLGVIIVAFLVGYFTKLLKGVKPPRWLVTFYSMVYPVLVAVIVGAITWLVVIPVFSAITNVLTGALTNLLNLAPIVVGIVIGAMCGADFGGPINKVAFLFSYAALGDQIYEPMAIFMASACVPSIGMGLATLIRPKAFSKSEKKLGIDSIILGAFTGFSEGAIPFAMNDFWRTCVASMVGCATSSALAAIFRLTEFAPGSGLIGGPMICSNPILYLVSMFSGSIVCALMAILLKGNRVPPEDDLDDDED